MDVIVPGIPLIVTGRPHASSTAYALATAIGYTHPYEFSDLADLANTIQHDYEGNAAQDTPLSKEQMVDALNKYGVKFIDMQGLVDTANASQNFDDVRHEVAAMNKNAVLQIFLLKSDSKLALAVNNPEFQTDPSKPPMISGPLLHPWTQGDAAYAIVRSGYATDKNIGRYYDTLLSSSPIEMPTPITWQNITDSGIVACLAILAPSVQEVPPSDFRYYGGLDADSNPITNTWPKEITQFDPAPVIAAIQSLYQIDNQAYADDITSLNAQIEAKNTAKQQRDAAFMDALHQLGLKDETALSTPQQPTTPVPDPTNGNPAGQLM